MKYDYFHALIDPKRPISMEHQKWLTNGGWRLVQLVALPDGMVYTVYERELI